MPGGVGLGCEHASQALGVEVCDQAVVEDAGRVEDRGERVLGGDRRDQLCELVAVGGIALGGCCLAAELGQLRDQLHGAGRLLAATAEQQQVAGAVGLCEVAGGERAEAGEPAGDQDGALGVDRLGNGEDVLADVPGLAEEAECLGCFADVPAPQRGVGDRAPPEEREDLGEDPLGALGGCFTEVKGSVGDAWVGLGDALWVADVGLSHLQEATSVWEQVEGGVDELAGEGVEDRRPCPLRL